jgi:two-component system OmpR family sensor kinase/two-component system sensor histidine kinase BaeS
MHDRSSRPGFRPPWWPENESFPPSDPHRWLGARRWFLRRIAVFFLLFFAVMFAANAIAVAVLSRGDRGVRPHLVWALGIFLAVGFIVVSRAIRRMAMPVGEVMEAAERVADGDYAVRVGERGPRETRRLARSFNAMAQRLEVQEDQRRNLLADVAHELRTPLSVIQGNAEGMIDGLYPMDRAHLEPLLEEAKVMARLLDDLRTLSTAEAGALQLHREAVDPGQLAEDAVAAFRPAADAAGVRLTIDAPETLRSVRLDPLRIGEVLSNLLSNAVLHTPSGGTIGLSVERSADGHAVVFTVRDSGPGIAPDLLPHVFERFVKGGTSRGAGLGLAIAKGLVEAHGGTISARNDPGGGTSIGFEVPG